MSGRQIFCITQESLVVWLHQSSAVERTIEFPANDTGIHEFRAYLERNADRGVTVLVDVIEEEFSVDSIPVVGGRDRRALMLRRLQRKFPRTPYRTSRFLRKDTMHPDAHTVVHSGVSNHELLDPWLDVMLEHSVSITGIHSVPLVATDILARIGKESGARLLISQHQEVRLRQVFLRDRSVQSARLSQSPQVDDADYPEFVVSETLRSRRYLERTRLLDSLETLNVTVIAEPELAERIGRQAAGNDSLAFEFVSTMDAARATGLRARPEPGHHEALFVSQCARKRPANSYATSGETRYHTMRRFRQAAIVASMSTAFLFSGISGLYLSDAWNLGSRASSIEKQVLRLSETLRRENERYEPIRADSHEMKVTVDTGDFILANRVPAPWVMQQLGLVMGDFRDVRISRLSWTAESASDGNQPVQRRNAKPLPVPIPKTISVTASVMASLEDYDGDLRAAFERIDALVAELRRATAFSDVSATAYPVDARPQVALSGEIAKGHTGKPAEFRLQMTYRIATDGESGDETI